MISEGNIKASEKCMNMQIEKGKVAGI